jgi:hypothetical protein
MTTAERWRTPLVVLIAGCVVLSLNMGLRQTHGLFIGPMTLDGASRPALSPSRSACRTCCGAC